MTPEIIVALRYAAQMVKFAVDAYKAIRAAISKDPDAAAEIEAADLAIDKAIAELPGIHAKQRADLGKP